MHRTTVYPNKIVKVVINNKDFEVDVETEAEVDLVSDALDVLDEHFQNHGMARIALNCVREIHNQGCAMTCSQPCNQSGMYGDPPSLNLGEGAMLRG